MKHSLSLAQRDAAVIWHPFTQMETAPMPIPISHGKGALLYDEDGNSYIDAIASWWMNLHGHAHPYLAQRLHEQAQKLEHVIFANFTHEPAVALAEQILAILPPNQAKVFYSDNGSTAVEVAIKMAIQFWHNQTENVENQTANVEKIESPRRKIVALRGGYHGDTFGAMSVGARSAFSRPFDSYLFDVLFIDPPKDEASLLEFKQYCAQYPDEIAAFIFEPLIQGAAGMQIHSAKHLDEIIQYAQNQQIICIADEVMTGFGRTGKNFATDYCLSKPDIYCLSKGLAAGMLPLGMTTCTAKIFDAFKSATQPQKTFFHGHSHAGNPLVCAVGLASLELLLQADTQANIERISQSHADFAKKIAAYPAAKNTRQLGVIFAFDWLPESTEKQSYFNQRSGFIWNFFIEKRLILRPLGNTIYILPPYCISQDELNSVYKGIIALLQLPTNTENFASTTNNAVTNNDIFI
jgi:adenosylmethionine-8-amino-7-oxononanoate aminotransferase